MDGYLVLGVSVFLGTVFAVLGLWHRSIQETEEESLAEELREAEATGTNQALTQHPQIDINRCLGCGSCVQACPEQGVLALVEGKARLVHAAHCVGHGCCETACPVGALKVGLGDLSNRTDIPVLNAERETSVPGVYIVGELGGIGLIRHAIAQGAAVVETIARRLEPNRSRDILDVLIVGCGPSGIASSLRAHELGLRFEVIDQDDLGGAVRKYPRNKMTLTQPVDLPLYGRMKRTQYSKEELIALWENIFDEAGIGVRTGVKFNGLHLREDGLLEVETNEGKELCRQCVLALGRRGTPRKLGVPGEESERVLYQLIDATDYSGKNLVVVGGGDSAIEAALALAAQPGNRIVLSYRRNAFFRIKPRNRDRLDLLVGEGRISVLLNSEVRSIDAHACRIAIGSEEHSVPADYVFILAGGEPPYPLLQRSGVAFGGVEEPMAASLKEAS